MNAALAGHDLVRTDFRVPRYATSDLSGRRVAEVVARGKHLLIRLSGATTIHAHFKMDGSFHLYRPGERWRASGSDARVVLETASWVSVGFLLGDLDVVPSVREEELVGHLGPDLLGIDWDPAEAVRRLARSPAETIGDALLDQRNLAGIGNVYKSELCFLRGLHPRTPVRAVNDLAAAVDLARRTMWANRDHARHVTTGDLRRGRGRWVYGRRGRPCRRCGTPIEKEELGPAGRERVTYWCPRCQPSPNGG